MVRTDFSLGESALKAENAVKIAREAGYTAVISADSMNIASVIPLQRAAGDDMAVICGVKLNIVDDPTYEHRVKLAKESMRCMESLERGRNYSFTALIKNEKGYRDICELMTAANTREQFYLYRVSRSNSWFLHMPKATSSCLLPTSVACSNATILQKS